MQSLDSLGFQVASMAGRAEALTRRRPTGASGCGSTSGARVAFVAGAVVLIALFRSRPARTDGLVVASLALRACIGRAAASITGCATWISVLARWFGRVERMDSGTDSATAAALTAAVRAPATLTHANCSNRLIDVLLHIQS